MERIQLRSAGQTFKTRGLTGQLVFELEERYMDFVSRERVLFFLLEGDAVPYFIKPECNLDEDDLMLEEVEDPETAKMLANSTIYIDASRLQGEDAMDVREEESSDFLGYTLEDKSSGKKGVITSIEQFPAQVLLVITIGQKQFYLPLREEWILDVSVKKKRITMQLPEGMFD